MEVQTDWTFIYRGEIDGETLIPHQFTTHEILLKSNDERQPQLTLFRMAFIPGIGLAKWDDVRVLWDGYHYLNLSCPYPYYLKIRPYRGFQGLNVSIWKASMPLVNGSTHQQNSSTATGSTISAVTTSVILLAENSSRLGATIQNNSNGRLYLDFDLSVTSSDYAIKMDPGAYYEVPYNYTGPIAGVWSTANGNALIREFL